MNRKIMSRTVITASALLCLSLPQVAPAATSALPCLPTPAASDVASCATGVYANISVLGGAVGATLGPVDDAFGKAPGAYNTGPVALASLNASLGLAGLLGLNVKTGVITDRASSPYTGSLATLSSTATSTVSRLNLFLGTPAITAGPVTVTPASPLITVGARTLSSTSSASKTTGSLVTSGSSFITDLVISVLGNSIPINASAFASLPVNYDILSADALNIAGLSIYANYQTPVTDGPDRIGTQTSALAIFLNGFDGGLLSGKILIAESAAAVPEPSSWMMMIFGFGLVGAVARRRQAAALAVA